MKKNNFLKNILSGFGGQFIAIILGLIVPRFFISGYGSDVNGLISTITQIFTYMALLEAGVGQAAKNVLFKPVRENNKVEINKWYSVALKYFRRLTIYYGIGVVTLALVLPYVIKTNVAPITIFWVVLFEGLAGVTTFYFIQTPSILLTVDGKSYVNNNITLINKIVGYIAKIVLAICGINIIFLQLTYFLINVAKLFFYQRYLRKNYTWLKYQKVDNSIKLKDRNSFVITEIAWTIFSSTDMIVLSTFLSTQLSSVYSVYNMIFTNLNVLLNAVYNSINYLLGYTYHEDIKKYEIVHDSFNSVFIGTMTCLMSICIYLTIPFVKLYTNGITDIEYIYESLPVMFCLIQILSWSRYVTGNLTALSGYAKKTSYISLAEAVTNISLSIILVNKYRIIGVTIATVVALPLKVLWCLYVSDKKVMHRSYRKSITILGANYLLFFVNVVISRKIRLPIFSYGSFLFYGLVISSIVFAMGIIVNITVNKDCALLIKNKLFKKK